MQQITIREGIVELQEVGEVKRAKLSEFLDNLTEQAGIRTPILPAGTIHYATRGKISLFALEVPPARRTLTFRPREGRSREFSLAFPWLYLLVAFSERALDRAYVYFAQKPIRTAEDQLCHAPLPNRYSQDGSVCLGNYTFEVTLPQVDKVRDVVRYYLESSFTNEILESFNAYVPEEIAVRTGSGEDWFDGWQRLTEEEIAKILWKPYKPFQAAVQAILEGK